MSMSDEGGILPRVAEWASETPDSSDRLLSSEGLPKGPKDSLIQAWPKFDGAYRQHDD